MCCVSLVMEVNSLQDLASYINLDDEAFLALLQRCSLVRQNLRCKTSNCRRNCNLRHRQSSVLGHMFFCVRCRKMYPVIDGSFFATLRVPIRTSLTLLWNWVCEIQAGSSAMHLGLTRQTVMRQHKHFRDVCSWKLSQQPDLFLFGGPGHAVQVDESLLTKEKWIIGIYDCTSGKGYAAYIADRSSETLSQHIQKVVLPGSEIWTDEFESYRCLSVLGGVSPYMHRVVNHSRYFQDPVTGLCTNRVEGYCSRLKGMIRRLGVTQSPFLPEYIDMFLWWQHYGPTAADRFRNVLLHISEKYTF